jgi:hypothetical protein
MDGDHSLPINELESVMNHLKNSVPWELSKGSAVTFCPARSCVLRAMDGRAWVTFDLSTVSPLADAGDHFVSVGRDVPVRAGQRVVIEAWPDAGADSVMLVWAPLERPQAITNLLSRLKRRLDWLPLGQPARP